LRRYLTHERTGDLPAASTERQSLRDYQHILRHCRPLVAVAPGVAPLHQVGPISPSHLDAAVCTWRQWVMDFPPDVELPRQVGRVAMNWSHLEQATSITLWIAAELKVSQGQLLTTGVSLPTQWDQISARLLAASFSPDMREWFRDWRRRADALRIRRDDVIHAIWWPTGGSESPYWAIDALSRRARDTVQEDVMPGGTPALRGLANEIASACIDLVNWTSQVMGPQSASRPVITE
jgi:hypothetical protein